LFGVVVGRPVDPTLVLYYAAMAASRRLAEDNRPGHWNWFSARPTRSVRFRAGCGWLMDGKMLFRPTIASLIHFFFIWQGATMVVLIRPHHFSGTTPGELLGMFCSIADRKRSP